MTAGLIGMRFKPDATETQIQNIVSTFYSMNKGIIEGMQYFEFDKDERLNEIVEGL